MSPTAPVEIRVRGRIDDAALHRFAEAHGRIVVTETVLRGEVADQTELQGVVALLEGAGCELLEVRRLSRRRTDDAT
jgi:hypothetical protein